MRTAVMSRIIDPNHAFAYEPVSFRGRPDVAFNWTRRATRKLRDVILLPDCLHTAHYMLESDPLFADLRPYADIRVHPAIRDWFDLTDASRTAGQTPFRLSAAEREQLLALGNGNMMDGLRFALRRMRSVDASVLSDLL